MSSLEKLAKLNDICLYVNDFKGSLEHYTKGFGFKVKRLQPDAENANYAEFDFSGTTVTMWDIAGVKTCVDEKYLGSEGHHFMLAVKVPHMNDVDMIHEELVRNGVTCIAPPKTFKFGSRAAYFTDFEGNIWEVFAWLEGNGPGLL